jgi:uncharacterized protein DUF6980
MKQFCCEIMNQQAKLFWDNKLKDHTVIYDKRWRDYFVYFNEEKEQRDREMLTPIYFCPWCGTKLPVSLADDWYDILDNEYGIDHPAVDKHKVPPEFQTDEWWRKRGL